MSRVTNAEKAPHADRIKRDSHLELLDAFTPEAYRLALW